MGGYSIQIELRILNLQPVCHIVVPVDSRDNYGALMWRIPTRYPYHITDLQTSRIFEEPLCTQRPQWPSRSRRRRRPGLWAGTSELFKVVLTIMVHTRHLGGPFGSQHYAWFMLGISEKKKKVQSPSSQRVPTQVLNGLGAAKTVCLSHVLSHAIGPVSVHEDPGWSPACSRPPAGWPSRTQNGSNGSRVRTYGSSQDLLQLPTEGALQKSNTFFPDSSLHADKAHPAADRQ